jgi:hypothetical protein
MQGSGLWRSIAVAEATAEQAGNFKEELPAAQAHGLMWDARQTTNRPPQPVAQLPFDHTATHTAVSGQVHMHPQISSLPLMPPMPPMPPPIPMPPMHALEMAPDKLSVHQLIAFAMPESFAGLTSFEIEGKLRDAAAQIDVYDD